MSILQHKIDFVALISVTNANPNGDPLNGNRPRTDYNGHGEISDVCIKRKIRNRMQDQGFPIFVQSEDRSDDGFDSLSKRAAAVMSGIKDRDEYARIASENGWMCVLSDRFCLQGGECVDWGSRPSIYPSGSQPFPCRYQLRADH